ncbi:MAG: hypothetical protein A3F13_07490 [Gammaproteobacteria bacterium RIFCSPHIGHO2_12_FULL_40_19]|nr:MAG: hypothetical protein A3F13_07490 [Gammaproteobacteria bacterium RIFCSPHIGHO2_12_FULL_40_19]
MSQDLILFATADWAEQYWTNKQRMADQFSQLGFRVLYVESFGLRSPGANKKDIKRLLRRLWTGLLPAKKIKEDLWVLSPLVIPHWQNPRIAKLNYCLLSLQIKIFKLFHLFKTDLVWTYHPFIMPLLTPLQARSIYYHVVDNITAVPNVDAQLYLETEKKFMSQITALFVTSFPLKVYYESLTQKPVYYSPNVVDVEHFAKARDSQSEPTDMRFIARPRLLYYGVLSDFKIDVQLLNALAQKRPEWQIVLIGEEREGQNSPLLQALKKLSNVHFLGYRAYANLPLYLSAVDVGILPLDDNPYTRFMFPMKFFEFLAAGVPVVSTGIDALKPYQHFFALADDAEGFVAAIEKVLLEKKSKLTVDEMEKNYSWHARMAQVLCVLNSTARDVSQ